MVRSYAGITRYVAREFLLSFLVAFLFFFFIFFVNQLLLMAEQVLTKHVGAWQVFLLIVYSMPAIVALSFPFGSLVGVLMTVGRFSADNEIIAFKASGIPLFRLYVPIAVLGLVFSSASFVMNDYFLPLGTINFAQLYRQLLYSNPALELEPYSVKQYQDTVLVTGAVNNRRIDHLVIIDRTDDKSRRVIVAKSAELTQNAEQTSVISLKLEDVVTETVPPGKPDQFDYSSAKEMVYNILLKDLTVSIQNPSASEMSSADLLALIRKEQHDLDHRRAQHDSELATLRQSLRAEYFDYAESSISGTPRMPPADQLNNLTQLLSQVNESASKQITSRVLQVDRMEFHKKLAIPFACVIFTVFAFPVGLFARRSGRIVGFGVGVLVSITYWVLLIAGIAVGSEHQWIPPFWAMWTPDFFFLALGIVLFVLRYRR